jgi:hypothetical protein
MISDEMVDEWLRAECAEPPCRHKLTEYDRIRARRALSADAAACDHPSLSGDEGPIALLGRWPRRWRCDSCGEVTYDREESQ